MDPQSGFFIQSTNGKRGNFEVTIPWPDGGFAHYWRDNDSASFPWIGRDGRPIELSVGPALFGSGIVKGVALIQSDLKSAATDYGNLELLAIVDRQLASYYRVNRDPYTWVGPAIPDAPNGFAANPTLIQAGIKPKATPFGAATHQNFLSVIYDAQSQKLLLGKRDNTRKPDGSSWSWAAYMIPVGDVSGLSYMMSTVGTSDVDYSGEEAGDEVIVLCDGHDNLVLFRWHKGAAVRADANSELEGGPVDDGPLPSQDPNDSSGPPDNGYDPLAVGGRQDSEGYDGPILIGAGYRGRPGIIQSRFGYVDTIIPFENDHFGNYEIVVPRVGGGLAHFWKENGVPELDLDGLGSYLESVHPWEGPVNFADGYRYDEVSLIQSNFSSNDGQGNLEVVARQTDQAGFDHWYRDDAAPFQWHGPTRVGSRAPVTSTRTSRSGPLIEMPESLTEMLMLCTDTVLARFSRSDTEAGRSWGYNSSLDFAPTAHVLPAGHTGSANLGALEMAKPTGVSLVASRMNDGNAILVSAIRLEPVISGRSSYLAIWDLDLRALHPAPVVPLLVDGKLVENVTGCPAMIQASFGAMGNNYELLVPRGLDVVHFYRDNAGTNFLWYQSHTISFVPAAFATGTVGRAPAIAVPLGVCLFQTSFKGDGRFGNLEAIIRMHPVANMGSDGDYLVSCTLDTSSGTWGMPFPIIVDGRLIDNVSGDPSCLQGTLGNARNNYELAVPRGIGISLYFRDNSVEPPVWRHARDVPLGGQGRVSPSFGQVVSGFASGVSIFQSRNKGNRLDGNLEMVAQFTPVIGADGGSVLYSCTLDTAVGTWDEPRRLPGYGVPLSGISAL